MFIKLVAEDIIILTLPISYHISHSLVGNKYICYEKPATNITPEDNVQIERYKPIEFLPFSYKNNYHSEGIRYANALTVVIIFCKSRPHNCN